MFLSRKENRRFYNGHYPGSQCYDEIVFLVNGYISMEVFMKVFIAAVILIVGVLISAVAKELVGLPNAIGLLITLAAVYLYWSKSSSSDFSG